MPGDDFDVEFFWDPVCPWAWITSRWVTEVAAQRDISVRWRFIALRLLNGEKDYERDFPPGYVEGHGIGLKLLRVAAAVRASDGEAPMAGLYTRLGSDFHVDGRRDELIATWQDGMPEYVREVLRDLELDENHAGAANDDAWDATLLEETETALSRTGRDVGTPIITFDAPDGPSFFGPVLSSIPRGVEAVKLWDAIRYVAEFPGMAELKRSVREAPVTS